MKTAAWFFALFAMLIVVPAQAQDDELDDFTFEEIPIDEGDEPYFAVGVGGVGTFLFMDMDPVNVMVQDIFPDDEISSPLLLTGVEGFIPTFWQNVRLGFYSASGGKELTAEMVVPFDTLELNGHVRANFQTSMSALNFEYVIQTPLKQLVIIPGISAGWGGMTLERESVLTDENGNYVNPIHLESDTETIQILNESFENTYWLGRANVNIEFTPTEFLMIRAQAGYMATFNGDWEVNGFSDVTIPEGDMGIESSGAYAGFAVAFGFF